jgi:hypothetical protein
MSDVYLIELVAHGVRLSHAEAVTIAHLAAVSTAHGDLSGIPDFEQLRLCGDGRIEVAGAITRGDERDEALRAVRLLAALLAHAVEDGAASETFRRDFDDAFPGDEAQYESLHQFIFALAPFAAPDAQAVARRVVFRLRNAIDTAKPLDEFATENRVDDVDEPLDEFATEGVSIAEPEVTSAPGGAPPWYGHDAVVLPVAVELRPPSTDEEIIGDAPLFQPWEISARPRVTRRSGRWMTAAAMTAVLAGVLSALWFIYNSSPSPLPAQHPPRHAQRTAPDATESRSTNSLAADAPSADRSNTDEPAAKPATAGFSPSFASADSTMFYHSGTGPGSAIMRADTDERGTVVRVSSVVKDRASNFHARPSPDGRRLAFDSDRDGERGIYVADVNGQGARRVSGPGFASVPSWSPDGRRIAFVRAEARRPHVWNVWILDLAGGDSTRITSHRYGQPWGATWFPDGNRIAYSHEARLIVRTLDGKDVRIFNSPLPGRLLRTPAVSPDGRQIVFQVHRDGAWMLDLASGSMSRVLNDPSAEEFTWSRDGQQLAYHSHRSGTWSVWVMASRG